MALCSSVDVHDLTSCDARWFEQPGITAPPACSTLADALNQRDWSGRRFVPPRPPFKWIKQHLRIQRFLGTSENALKTQIWCAVSTDVLIAIVHRANLAAAATREPFTSYPTIALLYLVATTVSILLLAALEKRYSLGVRRVGF